MKPLKNGLLRLNTYLEQRVKGKDREWIYTDITH